MYLIILVVILIIFILTHIYNKMLRRCKIDKIYGKSVMVTGCDSELGLEMAKHLRELGTIATCLNPLSNGYRLLNLLGDRCKAYLMDITNAEFDWLTSSQIKSQIDVNYYGPIILTKLLLEDIINSQGRLVYVTSLISNVPFPLCKTYCSTKSGLSMFAEGLQAEVSRFGVKIILLQPGDFTKLTDIVPATLKASDIMWNQRVKEGFLMKEKKIYMEIISLNIMRT
ncbi:estradiol 17-beta-dehydrogenase 2-like [Tetranychus urticae]|uniref:estradiol 17-beta-dehydrogenase 2-like n=1 Tax=Tetranychus urticae TaxID=32264 RepID=UPI000D645569|nr:estradiol 17-beta-dehydrogenase 2-like [Tetranychus urticae]